MLTQFKRLSLFFALVSVFSITPRARTRYPQYRQTCVQERSGVAVTMTDISRRERNAQFGYHFTEMLNERKLAPVKVKVKNNSAESVTLAKKDIGLPYLEHEEIMT